LDFGALLALTAAEAPSVFQIRSYDVTPAALGERVIDFLHRFEYQLAEGALVVANVCVYCLWYLEFYNRIPPIF